MDTIFKVIAILFTILFVWAAALQYNDPDALKWYVIYGMGAFASILFLIKQLKFTWILILFVFYVGFAIYNLPTKFEGFTIGEGAIANIEKAREVGGLLILAISMFIYGLRIRAIKN